MPFCRRHCRRVRGGGFRGSSHSGRPGRVIPTWPTFRVGGRGLGDEQVRHPPPRPIQGVGHRQLGRRGDGGRQAGRAAPDHHQLVHLPGAGGCQSVG